MKFQIFSEKIEFSKLNLKIEFNEPLNGSWKVLGCNTEQGSKIAPFPVAKRKRENYSPTHLIITTKLN